MSSRVWCAIHCCVIPVAVALHAPLSIAMFTLGAIFNGLAWWNSRK